MIDRLAMAGDNKAALLMLDTELKSPRVTSRVTRIGLFYGSTDGHTAAVAAQLKTRLDAFALAAGVEAIELFDVADYYLEEMLDFDCLVLASPPGTTASCNAIGRACSMSSTAST